MRRLAAALLALAAVICAMQWGAPALAEVAVPALRARVTDLTGTLSEAQRAELEASLAAYEARRGSQMAVLMLPSTKPEEIEQYAIRVAEAWKVGRKGVDDGVILVVAKDDRRVRIEVGYGLEGAIPDSVAQRVIDERLVPRFREGDFFGGLRDAADQLIRLAEGEKLPPPSGRARGDLPDPASFLVPALFAALVIGTVLKALLGRLPGSLATGAGLGAIAWVLFGATIALFAAVGAFLVAFLNTGVGRGGRWSSGGGSWGGSSGGSSSSWGGGGGGFGGGGSSGRW